MSVYQALQQFFKTHKLEYEELNHDPFFSATQGEQYCESHGFPIPKNLVMTNKTQDQFWMITVCGNKRTDLNKIKKRLEISGSKFVFAPPEFLAKFLRVTPGSASPFGLLFDTEKKVQHFLDQDFKKAQYYGFHPNQNTKTWKISPDTFTHFFDSIDRKVQYLEIPEK